MSWKNCRHRRNSNDVRVVGFDATITAIDQVTEPDPSEPARYEFAVDDVEVTLDRATGEIHLRLIAACRRRLTALHCGSSLVGG